MDRWLWSIQSDILETALSQLSWSFSHYQKQQYFRGFIPKAWCIGAEGSVPKPLDWTWWRNEIGTHNTCNLGRLIDRSENIEHWNLMILTCWKIISPLLMNIPYCKCIFTSRRPLLTKRETSYTIITWHCKMSNNYHSAKLYTRYKNFLNTN